MRSISCRSRVKEKEAKEAEVSSLSCWPRVKEKVAVKGKQELIEIRSALSSDHQPVSSLQYNVAALIRY